MEDNKSKIFFNRVDSNVILFLGTMIFGGIVILFGYIISRYARYHDELDSTKDTMDGEKNKGVDSRDSFPGSSTTSNVNKRTKNKKRREVQQEFSHSWVVGTLKGHTSTIFNMSFSSNGKQLASCAEDGKRLKEMESLGGVPIPRPTTATKATIPPRPSSYSYPPNQHKSIPPARFYNIPNDAPRYVDAIYNPQPPGSMVHHQIRQRNYHWVPHNAEYQYQQLYIPEYNQNKNVDKLNHYQQEARNVYFHQLYMQLISIQQLFNSGRPVSNHNNWQFQNLYNQQLPAQLGHVNIETNYHTALFENGVSPYWMEGRYPSKKTYGYVRTKRCEFIINDTILEYVLRTYVHHPLYLIEAGYPCTWNFDTRFQQFVNNLHKPFILKNPNGQAGAINNVQTTNDQYNKLDNDEQQTRDCVRSSSFTSSSRRAFINESMMRQRSSSISTVVELNAFETRCSMCLKAFYLYRANGDLNRPEVCVHHPGELIFHKQEKVKTWTCCRNRASVLGCKTETTHIWKSFKKNFASPQIDYVRTKPSETQPENRIYGIYGIDCEMVTTKNGLELAKVSLVNIHGHIVYNEYVIPRSEVIDYNTRFSGITADKLATATKTLHMVQKDLLEFIKAETILIGHALENDLKVLRIIHYTCIDTALLLKHPDDLPFRHSLRVLSKGYLKRVIQKGSHDSVEDTLSAMDLVLFKLRDDGF